MRHIKPPTVCNVCFIYTNQGAKRLLLIRLIISVWKAFLLSASEEITMQLSRSRNSHAPLGRKGAARWRLGPIFQVGSPPQSPARHVPLWQDQRLTPGRANTGGQKNISIQTRRYICIYLNEHNNTVKEKSQKRVAEQSPDEKEKVVHM